MTLWRVFGLVVETEHAAPGLESASGSADVRIREGEVPLSLANPRATGVRFQAAPGELLLSVDGVGRFLARQGNEIVVQPRPGVDSRRLAPFLYGSAFGALLHQRGMLPLHASAVEIGTGECAVFMGVSTTGKSTLAFGLSRLGYKVLTDDVCAITRVDDLCVAQPGMPWLKLCGDMAKHFEWHSDGAAVHSELGKELMDLAIRRKATPPRKVFSLTPSPEPRPSLEPITGSAKVETLMSRTYRRLFIDGMAVGPSHFKACLELAAQVEIFALRRPEDIGVVDEVIELVDKKLRA